MRFVDTFLFSEPHESDVLWVKLNVEDKLIDEWVVVENSHTHQGRYKGFFFNDLIANEPRFHQFRSKIHVIESDIVPHFDPDDRKIFDSDATQIDRAQRAKAVPYIVDNYDDQDYVLLSDVDECLDADSATRRRLLRRKVRRGEDHVLVPRIRYWFDYDNRWSTRRCVNLVSVRQLKKNGDLDTYLQERSRPVIWRHEMMFEYSFCFSREGIDRKMDSFLHTGFSPEDVETALRYNHRPISAHRPRQLSLNLEWWFEKRRLTPRNSPAFVRKNLALLRTDVVSRHYRKNRVDDFPQLFPRSRFKRMRNSFELHGAMYASNLSYNSRRYRNLVTFMREKKRRLARLAAARK